MLGLLCRHCGTIETTHNRNPLDDVVTKCLADATLLTYQYYEEVHAEDRGLERGATADEYAEVQVPGYKHTLATCPGFAYQKSDRAELVSLLAEKTCIGLDDVDCLPEAWATAVHRSRAKAARAEEKRFKTARQNFWSDQRSILVIPGRGVIQLD